MCFMFRDATTFYLISIFKARNFDGKIENCINLEGAKLQFTCKKHFMEQMRGSIETECKNGEWTTQIPHCIPLDVRNKQGNKHRNLK